MTQERNPGFQSYPENENPYDPTTENWELKLTPESVAEFATDFKRVVDIAKLESAKVPRQGLYFICPPNRKIGYVENPSKPGTSWNRDARLYSMSISSQVGDRVYNDPLVTLTNAPHAFERKDGVGFHGAKIQFGVSLLVDGKPETYMVYFWETEPASLQLIDEILNSFMFESILEVPEAVRNGVNKRFTPNSEEDERASHHTKDSSVTSKVTKLPEKSETKSTFAWLASVISQKISQLWKGKAS